VRRPSGACKVVEEEEEEEEDDDDDTSDDRGSDLEVVVGPNEVNEEGRVPGQIRFISSSSANLSPDTSADPPLPPYTPNRDVCAGDEEYKGYEDDCAGGGTGAEEGI